jgi:hypothetical protein
MSSIFINNMNNNGKTVINSDETKIQVNNMTNAGHTEFNMRSTKKQKIPFTFSSSSAVYVPSTDQVTFPMFPSMNFPSIIDSTNSTYTTYTNNYIGNMRNSGTTTIDGTSTTQDKTTEFEGPTVIHTMESSKDITLTYSSEPSDRQIKITLEKKAVSPRNQEKSTTKEDKHIKMKKHLVHL